MPWLFFLHERKTNKMYEKEEEKKNTEKKEASNAEY